MHAQRLGEDGIGQRHDHEHAEFEFLHLGAPEHRGDARKHPQPDRQGQSEEHHDLASQHGHAGQVGQRPRFQHGGQDRQQDQAEHVVDHRSGHDGAPQVSVEQTEVHQHADGHRHGGDGEGDGQEHALCRAQVGVRKEHPAEPESRGERYRHAERRDRERTRRGLRHLGGPQFHACQEHQEEDAEIRDGGEYRIVSQLREDREIRCELMHEYAEGDAGDEFSDERRLFEPLGDLGKQPTHREQDQQGVEQFHGASA